MTILVMMDGVLQSERDHTISDGVMLVRALVATQRIVVVTHHGAEHAEHLLRTEKLLDRVAEIIDHTVDLSPYPLWQRQVEVARNRYPISLVLTARPEVAQWLVEHSLCALFFAHPGYSRPARRPDQGNRTWVQLVEELEGRL